MKHMAEEQFLAFVGMVQSQGFGEYLEMASLKDGYAYKIVARNAYVGIWEASSNAFVISRYKGAKKPFIFREYHWDHILYNAMFGDTNKDVNGSAKPLALIEKAPFENYENENAILDYLDALEKENPLVIGFDSLEDRKNCVMSFSRSKMPQKSKLGKPLKNHLDE